MWKRLPLRTRLFLPLGMMFVAALVLGTVALHLFSTEQLAEESGPAVRSAEAIAGALNASLQVSNNPRQTLDAFTRALGTGEIHPLSRCRRSCPISNSGGGADAVRQGSALVHRVS